MRNKIPEWEEIMKTRADELAGFAETAIESADKLIGTLMEEIAALETSMKELDTFVT